MSGGDARLGHRTAWGVVWALLTTAGGRAISLVTLAVLARLLAPAEFGVLAFALACLAYLDTIGDLGTGVALVYWPARWREVAQVTFVTGLASSVVWFAVIWLLAPAIASFFGTSAATPILRALAWSFPIRALGTTHDAILQKELRFRARMLPELVMATVKAGVSIALAFAGFGVWSLVWGQLGGLAAWSASLWAISGWRPTWTYPRDLARPVLAYGRGIVGVNIVSSIIHRADLLVVGRMLGAASLGIYQIAGRIPDIGVSTVVGITGKVLFPAFSRLRADGRDLRAGYLTALRYVTLLTIPTAIGLAALAEPLVEVAFGARWAPAAPILRALAVYAGVRSLGSYTGDLLKATGQSGMLARLGLARAAALIPAMIAGARFGATGVAWALVAVTSAYLVVSLAIARRESGASYGEMLAAVRAPLAGGAVLAAGLALWLRLTSGLPAGLVLPGGVVTAVALYALVVRAIAPDLHRHALARLAPEAE